MNSYIGKMRMGHSLYPSTIHFDTWRENTEAHSERDFLVLREAVQYRMTTFPYAVEVRGDKTFIRHMQHQLVLVLTARAREAFLKDLDRTCRLIK